MPSNTYLLGGSETELARLQLQARVWEPAAAEMVAAIGVEPGWTCLDIGCGAMGILRPLSEAVGGNGRVVGLDNDPIQLAAVRDWVRSEGLRNVEIVDGNAYHSDLPREEFDLTHVRFLFAPGGRDEELSKEMHALTRPGGFIAIQEPDASSWSCYPTSAAWETLKGAILQAFRASGGDFDAGRRMFSLLHAAGLEDLRIEARVLALPPRHPYRRLPLQFAASLRNRILEGILPAETLDEVTREFERTVDDEQSIMLSFTLLQVWGRKPRES